MKFSLFENIIIWALPVIYAICLHEVAHGWVASKLGDPTAKFLGRLSLNPIYHITPIGTVLVPLLLLVLGSPFIFGWARPVPITWQNLKKPRRDMALVALAGPLSNFLMAIFWGFITVASQGIGLGPDDSAPLLFYMAIAGIQINLILMTFNLLPLPPLDGSRILASVGSRGLRVFLAKIEPYGFVILLFLILSGVFQRLFLPVIQFVYGLFTSTFGL